MFVNSFVILFEELLGCCANLSMAVVKIVLDLLCGATIVVIKVIKQ